MPLWYACPCGTCALAVQKWTKYPKGTPKRSLYGVIEHFEDIFTLKGTRNAASASAAHEMGSNVAPFERRDSGAEPDTPNPNDALAHGLTSAPLVTRGDLPHYFCELIR